MALSNYGICHLVPHDEELVHHFERMLSVCGLAPRQHDCRQAAFAKHTEQVQIVDGQIQPADKDCVSSCAQDAFELQRCMQDRCEKL